MMSSAPRPSITSLPAPPSRMLPAPQSAPLLALGPRRSSPRRGPEVAAQRREDRPEAGDAVDAGLVEYVAADEAAAADVAGNQVVALEHVVELPARQGLDLVELVADVHVQDVQPTSGRSRSMFCGLRVALADLPVVASCAGDLLDARTAEADVVAVLHVVVVVAALAVQDVVAVLVGVAEEEQVAAVALHQVGLVATLLVVVSAVTEDGVQALTGDHEVVALAGERLVRVGPTVGEVLAGAGVHDVQAGAGVDGVVARTALGVVVAGGVGDDVVALTAQRHVGAVVALDDVVALVAQEGVVVDTAPDPVGSRGAVVDALAVDAGRVDAVALAVADRAVGQPDQQRGLVALRRRVVGDVLPCARSPRRCRPGCSARTCSPRSRTRRP